MNQSKVNTDKVLVNIKKSLYDLKEIDHETMSATDIKEFKKEIEEVESIALSILDKIKNK